MWHLRVSNKDDWKQIAQIHIQNWKEHYRGLVPQDYLDREVEADRMKLWETRFSEENSNQYTAVIDNRNDKIIAFACCFFNHDGQKGTYLDNLHVLTEFQGRGIGKMLMKNIAEKVLDNGENTGIYLHVLKGNTSGITFYKSIGGMLLKEYVMELPWGTEGVVIDYWWDAADLINL